MNRPEKIEAYFEIFRKEKKPRWEQNTFNGRRLKVCFRNYFTPHAFSKNFTPAGSYCFASSLVFGK